MGKERNRKGTNGFDILCGLGFGLLGQLGNSPIELISGSRSD